jgi:hypothetical protein
MQTINSIDTSVKDFFFLIDSVSLPRERIEGIKRMTMMYFTHGLFLICTQKISFVFTGHLSQYLQNVQSFSKKEEPLLQPSNPALLT